MGKEFVPGQVGYIDAGGIFAAAKESYIKIVTLQTKVVKLNDKIFARVKEAGRLRDEYEEAGDEVKAQAMNEFWETARAAGTRGLDLHARIGELRIQFMVGIVNLMRMMLDEVRRNRDKVESSWFGNEEEGLVELDASIAQAEARWEVYAYYLGVPVEGGDATKVPTAEALRFWSIPEWDRFKNTIQNPILIWDMKQCREKWEFSDEAPPCKGPDLLYVLSLGNQADIAREAHFDNVIKFGDDLKEGYYNLVSTLERAVEDLAGAVLEPLVRGLKRSFRSGGILAWGAIGIGGLWIAKKTGFLK